MPYMLAVELQVVFFIQEHSLSHSRNKGMNVRWVFLKHLKKML